MSAYTESESFEYRLTRIEWLAAGVAHLILDDPKSSANVMTAELQIELSHRLQAFEGSGEACRGLLVSSGKPKIYIAGADVKYIARTADFSRDQVIEFCERGLRLYQRFSQLPFPTMALIQGACLGGGFEFALALDYRVAANAPNCQFGLPEVHLGLIPGWAATVRVPRLSSVETAMRIIGSGNPFSPANALDWGLIDEMVPAESLVESGLAKLLSVAADDWRVRRQKMLGPATCWRASEIGADSSNVATSFAGILQVGVVTSDQAGPETDDRLAAVSNDPSGMGDSVDETPSATSELWDPASAAQLANEILTELRRANPRVHPHAPQLVVELIARSAREDFFAACDLESQAMAEVYTSATGQALVHAFLLQDRAKKSPGLGAPPQPSPSIRRVGIVGLGLMGKSISQLMLGAPWQLTLYDQDPAVRQEVAGQWPSDQVTVVDSLAGLSDCDAVIENVFEQLACKREVLHELEQVLSPQAWLFSNTSVIPVTDLAAGLSHPERFCGLHFFNPIRETKLAEIARQPRTAPPTLWVASQLAKQLKKMVIVVGDGPGLVVNRLLMALLNEAQRLLAEGHAIQEIDRAATDFGWRLGPFQIMDVIGLKTAFDAGAQIAKYLPQAVTAPPFLIPLLKAGRLGQQRGLGFYRYTGDGPPAVDEEVETLVNAYRRTPVVTSAQSVESLKSTHEGLSLLAHRLVAAMLVQADAILEREQVRDAAEVDLCCLLALGFPPHHGGLLYWADHYPVGRLCEEIDDPELAAALSRTGRGSKRFYAGVAPAS